MLWGSLRIRYVQQVRVDQAVHLLLTTDRSLDRIAQSVGYRDAATPQNLTRRRRRTTVSELRRRAYRAEAGCSEPDNGARGES